MTVRRLACNVVCACRKIASSEMSTKTQPSPACIDASAANMHSTASAESFTGRVSSTCSCPRAIMRCAAGFLVMLRTLSPLPEPAAFLPFFLPEGAPAPPLRANAATSTPVFGSSNGSFSKKEGQLSRSSSTITLADFSLAASHGRLLVGDGKAGGAAAGVAGGSSCGNFPATSAAACGLPSSLSASDAPLPPTVSSTLAAT
mmetsp:Transcript_22382/g.69288  ORF Transcript_22382/g.69288 Transcript_22382/m.69288 type:complete len:202 (-) Transcript_22382:769-1374(-)